MVSRSGQVERRELSGAEIRQSLASLLADAARQQSDVSHEDLRFEMEGDAVRITGIRVERRAYTHRHPFSELVAQDSAGNWMIQALEITRDEE